MQKASGSKKKIVKAGKPGGHMGFGKSGQDSHILGQGVGKKFGHAGSGRE